jgi:hypothetical protein
MSLKAYHTNGIFAVQEGNDRIYFEVDPQSKSDEIIHIDPKISPTMPSTIGDESTQPEEIILGPLPPPPLPTAQITVTRALGRSTHSQEAVLRLWLNTAFQNGEFNPQVVSTIRERAAGIGGKFPLRIDAMLPSNHTIDLRLLSRHVCGLAAKIDHNIEMRVGAKFEDE